MVAILVLGFIAWMASILIHYPDDGIYILQPDGVINALRTESPAAGRLFRDDQILVTDEHPWDGFQVYYPVIGKHIGDVVVFQVLRDGKIVHVPLPLAAPSLILVFDRLVAILVALGFWAVGTGVAAFKPSGRSGGIFFLWFQTTAVTLAAGASSAIGLIWASALFNSLLWLLGPLSLHFHLHFPEPLEYRRIKALLAGLYAIALAGIAPYIFANPYHPESTPWLNTYLSAGRLFLVFNLLLVVTLLIYSYRQVSTPGARGKIRLVLLGSGLAVVSFISLTILPDVLLQQPLVPYPLAFMLLILLPLTYGYAIFRLNFIEIDRQINRGATYILVYSILGGFYLVLYALMIRMLPAGAAVSPLVNTILVLLLASVFFPLHGQVQRFVDQVFYGSWYDYRLGVRRITEGLEQITDLNRLGQTVTMRLERILRLEEAVAFFRDLSGDFSVIEVSFARTPEDHSERLFPVLPRSSLTYLLKLGVVERQSLMRRLEQVTLSPQEMELLNTEQIHLWVPVIGHGQVQGLLALGPKLAGDIFSSEDMDILRVVVQQLGPMIENIHLLTRLKDYAGELEQRVEERTAELHGAKEHVEAILASVGDGVVVTDMDGMILRVNSAFEGLSGLAEEEVLERSLFSLFSDENGPPAMDAIRETMVRDHIWSGELAGRRPDSSRYDAQVKIAPLHDRQGQVMNYVSTFTDITRTKELDRLKDMFISDVSHELRTPITNIRLYLDLLPKAPADRQQRFMGVIKEQSEVLTKLVDDILDLSRLTISKTRKATFEDVNLNILVDQIVAAHLPAAEAAGLHLVFEPGPSGLSVRAEQNQVARMITNLISNAIRYTPRGMVRVSIRGEDGCACLEVQDSGIGIDAQDIPHLYERFYRGKNVRQTGIHGTGLGLAIVKEIVELHEGRITVESAPATGTTFRVWLPTSHF